ncbi:MAG: cytochrome c oxidase subunit 3 [Bauldia sp.]
MAEAHAPEFNLHGKSDHPYHLVNPSPWPLVGAAAALALALGFLHYMHSDKSFGEFLWVVPGLLGVLYVMAVWWVDVIKEANGGYHTKVVQLGLRYGMILFIASEVMFFVAWFWAFFNASLETGVAQHVDGQTIEYAKGAFTKGAWPPKGTEVFSPWGLPLLNTVILLTSSGTVTWAHHALIHNDRKGLVNGLIITVVLGVIFTALQAWEYAHAEFGYTSGIFGSTFFMATGFHGFHVIVGTIFLAVCLLRATKGDFKPDHHFGLEAAAWYWHFVDVVWLFLFSFVYVWSTWGHAAH